MIGDIIEEQLGSLLHATTADEVISILDWGFTTYGKQLGDADGYFLGHGNKDNGTVWDALRKSDKRDPWRTLWSGGENAYVMFAPDHTLITYIDGHVFLGDQRKRYEDG